MRVCNLQLLEKERWWLAWSTADDIARSFDKGHLMLQFNVCLAQRKLNIPEWRQQTRIIDVNGASVRYKIIQKVLLEDWDGIEDLIIEALRTSDITENEFHTWPALEQLHRTPYFTNALAKLN